MSQNSKIEWTDATWNPIRGCSRVSEGCRNCYAESVAYRFSGPGQPYEGLVRIGTDGQRRREWNGQVQFAEKHLLDPLKWKEPRRIFVNSMSDLFHEGVSDEQLDRIFGVMMRSGQHTFQVLTKRPERMLAYFSPDNLRYTARKIADASGKHVFDCDIYFPLINVHLGVSCENQETANQRIPLLLQTPADVRFISAEPLLGPINLHEIELPPEYNISLSVPGRISALEKDHEDRFYSAPASLDWVIVGGESGAGARPCNLEWIRGIVEQCKDAGVPAFCKQLGAKPMVNTEPGVPLLGPMDISDKKGGNIEEFPADLRVREFPEVRA